MSIGDPLQRDPRRGPGACVHESIGTRPFCLQRCVRILSRASMRKCG
ncbi:hypothetical protein DUNSADRAFT_11796 [Dunaliella salina]|uniref:Uncharacterized protein n=1 Tax=Dunaliella salina TaxID=3046 RepID=A0ABQ7GCI0_DUNSA|nr:hypothetical protein DUNSADRAFT_11796 [Dunaliella salina]|eukprot:KAF5832320.1 hypothetical protein DUNSADRAFT_11796 [Dunaliella salina]